MPSSFNTVSVMRILNHDIRGALNAVLNLSEIIANPEFQLNPTELGAYHTKVHWSAQHLNHLFRVMSCWQETQRNLTEPTVAPLDHDHFFKSLETSVELHQKNSQIELIKKSTAGQKNNYLAQDCPESLTFCLLTSISRNLPLNQSLTIFFSGNASGIELNLVQKLKGGTDDIQLKSRLEQKEKLSQVNPWLFVVDASLHSRSQATLKVSTAPDGQLLVSLFFPTIK